MINIQNKSAIDASYFNLLNEIKKLREGIEKLNLNKKYTKISIPFNGTYDLRNINKVILELENLTKFENRYLIIQELKLTRENNIPKLNLTGEMVTFQSE